MLDWLYNTITGRVVLKVMTAPALSKICGAFLDSRASRILIGPFIRLYGIDLTEYCSDDFRCFNDCFARRIRPGMRPFDTEPSSFVSPCDGLLTVCTIDEGSVIPVKQSMYSIASLLHSKKAASHYEGGYCLVFRLCVDDYHRYAYIDGGVKGDNHFIPGKLHTVQPVALGSVPVFTENCREFTVMHTENFGTVIQVEVGAMLVGKIHNYHGRHVTRRGEEKGRFMYGGSTVILLVEKDRVVIDEKILKASKEGRETPVSMGSRIGIASTAFAK